MSGPSDKLVAMVAQIERDPSKVARYVAEHATPGDPEDVLATLDRYAREEQFLMNIGPDKGPIVQELFAGLPADARVPELGAYCGYSTILFASRLGPAGRVVSPGLPGGQRRGFVSAGRVPPWRLGLFQRK